MSGWVKICGLRSERAIDAAIEAGADAVGFVFHAGSVRDVEPRVAARLAARVPARIQRIAVTRHPDQAFIDRLLEAFVPDALQTDAADFARLRLPSTLGRLPVLRGGAPLPAPLPPRFLYEGPQSGRGVPVDWEAARGLAATAELVLAGGLDPANVGAAIRRVRPHGVDVSSGIESEPGIKDPARIHAFVAAARAAWAD